jgi:uncharacterized protein (TIGR03663 family)
MQSSIVSPSFCALGSVKRWFSKLKSAIFLVGLPYIVAVASLLMYVLITRYFYLDYRPVHHDEGVNSAFVFDLFTRWYYPYQSDAFHGPLAFYFFAGVNLLFHDIPYSARFVAATFSVLIVILPYFYSKELGKTGALLAACLLAVSPAFHFYGRFAIHESTFAFFQLWATLSLLRWYLFAQDNTKTNSYHYEIRSGVVGLIVSVTGMVLIKETFTIWGVGVVVTCLFFWKSFQPLRLFSHIFRHPFLLCLSFTLWLTFYSGLGHHWQGVLNFFKAFLPWLKIGFVQEDHSKPWVYWLETIFFLEPLFFLAMVLSLAGVLRLIRAGQAFRVFSFLALVIFAVYSAIPYKTPWCILPILCPFVVPAALFLNNLPFSSIPLQRGAFFFMVCLGLIQGFEGMRINFCLNAPDFYHRYYYTETTREFKKFIDIYEELIGRRPDVKQKPISVNVSGTTTWPLAYHFKPQNLFWSEKHDLALFGPEMWMLVLDRPWERLRDQHPEVGILPPPQYTHYVSVLLRSGVPAFYVYYDANLVGDLWGGKPL